jgi:hypothetical protein
LAAAQIPSWTVGSFPKWESTLIQPEFHIKDVVVQGLLERRRAEAALFSETNECSIAA